MASCFRHTVALHKSLIMCNRTSSLKYFSSLSPVHDRVRNSSGSYSCKNLCDPKQVQRRYFFAEGLQNTADSIATSSPAVSLRNSLIQFHDFTGLPWWGTLIIAGVGLKLFVSFPCGVCQQHVSSRLELTKAQLDNMSDALKNKVLLQAKKGRWTPQKTNLEINREMRRQWKLLVVKNNCHPFKNFILFISQFPFWVVMTLTVRKFAIDVSAMKLDNPVPELQFLVGGPFWCQNLAVPDPTFILPLINALTMLINTEMNYAQARAKLGGKKADTPLTKIMLYFLRFMSVAFFFVSSASPAGLSLFWATTSSLSLLQNVILMSPKVRRLFRIPKTPNELSNPYRQVWQEFSQYRFKLFSKK